MKHLKKFSLNESKENESIFEYSEALIDIIKKHNPILEDLEYIMNELLDLWGHDIEILYTIDEIELHTERTLSYFGMNEIDDELSEMIRDINSHNGKFELGIRYEYSNVSNHWKGYKKDDKFDEVIKSIKPIIESFGAKLEISESNRGVDSAIIKVNVEIPQSSEIDVLSGISKSIIMDYTKFVDDYHIDEIGRKRLSNIILKVNKKE